MIESITLKSVASFDEIGVKISDLKKVNYFFGFNGSGKSTIAKYLYNLSLAENFRDDSFKLCSQVGFNANDNQILVFDEKFTDDNFNKSSTLKGVFSLNQKNDEIDKSITEEEKRIKGYHRYVDQKRVLKETIEGDSKKQNTTLVDFCWSERNMFSALTKLPLQYRGSKTNHLTEIKRILKEPILETKSIEVLKDEYSSLYEREIRRISDQIDIRAYRQIRLIEIELDNLLSEVIVGNEDVDISSLIKKLDSRNWVEKGVEFLKITSNTCPFCQSATINSNLREQFDQYFDSTYKFKVSKLRELQGKYSTHFGALLSSLNQIQGVYNPSNITSTIYLELKDLFDSNKGFIEQKLMSPNEKKKIESLKVKKSKLSNVLKKIKENNKDYDELDAKREKLILSVWYYMAGSCKAKISEFEKRVIKYDRINLLINLLIDRKNEEIGQCRLKIEDLRKQTINTKEAIDSINLTLKNTGFEGFEIAEKSVVNNISQYFLKRNDSTSSTSVFRTLSEGEKNFISFLYFYQMCLGTDDIQENSTKRKVIVIDDPVSSLDSQSLFIVSTLIHQLISRRGGATKVEMQTLKNSGIEQVFIMTHNLYFYKEVSFDKRPICTSWFHYRIIKLNNRSSIIGKRDKTVVDDYQMMWKSLKDIRENIPVDNKQNIVIANLMRRVIDSYVSFMGLGKNSWASILETDTNDPTYYIKYSFIATINDESHKTSPMDSMYYQKIIAEQPQILFDIFKIIFDAIGKDHFDLMMNEQLDGD